jgi:predicted ester cyclase
VATMEEIARRWSEDVLGQGRVDVYDELVSVDAVDHSALPTQRPGVEGFKDRARMLHAAFGGPRVTVEDLIVQGDRMAWRWTMVGTHLAPLLGVAATGRPIRMTGMNIELIRDGKVVEHWSSPDLLGTLRQIQG